MAPLLLPKQQKEIRYVYFVIDMKEEARRQAERQMLPPGQQWHLVVLVIVPAFCTPTAGSHWLLNLNRFSGSQDTDNGPYTSSSESLFMPLQ